MEKKVKIVEGYPSADAFLAALQAGVELYDISLNRCIWWDTYLQRVAFMDMDPATALRKIADGLRWQDCTLDYVTLPQDLSVFYVRRY